MSKHIEAVTDPWSGLQVDFWRKVEAGQITAADFDRYLNLAPDVRAELLGGKPIDLLSEAIQVPQLEWQGHLQVFAAFRSGNKQVRICSVGNENKFHRTFELEGEANRMSPLVAYDVQKATVETKVIQTLGGENKVHIRLVDLYGLLCLQSLGQEGSLLNDGRPNWMFVRDREGLRTIRVHWRVGGWVIHLNALDDVGRIARGDRIIVNAAI